MTGVAGHAEAWRRPGTKIDVRKPSYRCWLAALAVAASSQVAHAQALPPAAAACQIQPPDLASWFATGTVTANGAVNPADSVNFSTTTPFSGILTDCDFFRWGAHMFLWVTSPAYESARVFQSPVFYNVSVAQNGVRTLIPNPRHFVNPTAVSLRSAQVGRDGKPTTFHNGRMISLEIPQVGPNRKTLTRNRAGKLVEIWRTRVSRRGKPVFLDKSGRVIDAQLGPGGKPFVLDKSGGPIAIARVVVGRSGLPVFLTSSGNVIDIEQSDPFGNVLMSQSGSYVYYAMFVNDFYAYFTTAQKIQSMCATQFPTTQNDLNAVVNFATANSRTLPDANALAVEIKTAWVTASSVSNPADYITMDAVIPTYDPTGVLTGSTQTTLALVGLHFVGTVLGHPEMIWMTFEHVGNTPDAAYGWIANGPVLHFQPQSTAGSWLFSSSTATSFNNANLTVSMNPPNITDLAGNPLVAGGAPSDTLRVNAWGTQDNSTLSSVNVTAAAKNTEVISLNNSVFAVLPPSDPRSKYLLIGGTWVTNGQLQGTTQLANSTLETYQQPSNCFDCHTRNDMLGSVDNQGHTTGLSHIYGQLKQLFGTRPILNPC